MTSSRKVSIGRLWNFIFFLSPMEVWAYLIANIQGFFLCAKWITHALFGNEAWKILKHCISQGRPHGTFFLKKLSMQAILIALVPFKISSFFLIKHIWRAWEALKSWLSWKGFDPRASSSISIINVFWSPTIMYQGLTLAQVQWIRLKRLYKKGIACISNFISWHTRIEFLGKILGDCIAS